MINFSSQTIGIKSNKSQPSEAGEQLKDDDFGIITNNVIEFLKEFLGLIDFCDPDKGESLFQFFSIFKCYDYRE